MRKNWKNSWCPWINWNGSETKIKFGWNVRYSYEISLFRWKITVPLILPLIPFEFRCIILFSIFHIQWLYKLLLCFRLFRLLFDIIHWCFYVIVALLWMFLRWVCCKLLDSCMFREFSYILSKFSCCWSWPLKSSSIEILCLFFIQVVNWEVEINFR